jgi:hypothetical protein
MTAVVSSVFRVLRFPHQWKIVTIDQIVFCTSDLGSNVGSNVPFFNDNQQSYMSVGDQNLDQGSKICSIFKVFGMRRKWCHCIRLVFLIPAVYLLSQTESVWRRYRDLFTEPNREKKWDADWVVRTVVRMLTWHDGTTHTWQSTWQVMWKSLSG